MPRDSPELKAVLERWLAAVQNRDADALLNLLSVSDATRYVGSDDTEWWQGRQVLDLYPPLVGRVPRYEFDLRDIEAYEQETIGWGAVRTRVHFAQLESLTVRLTMVFILEAGRWNVVQAHLSFPTANVDAVGVELTPGLEDLLAAIDTERRGASPQPLEGTATIMFTDIVSSTELAVELGDLTWANVLARQYRTARSLVEGHGGTVVKTLGDGTMARFHSARGALRAAVEIQNQSQDPETDPKLSIRIGLHTGDVIETDEDLLGQVVNKAARIASAADGGEIMLSMVTRAMVGETGFDFGDPMTVELKGLPGTHQVVRAIW